MELLLDGISGPRPGRARTTPQTGGQASAAYHAEHGLHRGRPAAGEDSIDVVVDRPRTPRAIPVAAVLARKAAQGNPGRADSTVVTERAIARRLLVAVVGALVVVALLFAFFRTRMQAPDRRSSVAAAQEVRTEEEPAHDLRGIRASPRVAASLAAPEAPEASADPALEPRASSESASSLAAEAPSAGAPAHPLVAPSFVHRRRRAGVLAAPPAASGNIGEFKTTF